MPLVGCKPQHGRASTDLTIRRLRLQAEDNDLPSVRTHVLSLGFSRVPGCMTGSRCLFMNDSVSHRTVSRSPSDAALATRLPFPSSLHVLPTAKAAYGLTLPLPTMQSFAFPFSFASYRPSPCLRFPHRPSHLGKPTSHSQSQLAPHVQNWTKVTPSARDRHSVNNKWLKRC